MGLIYLLDVAHNGKIDLYHPKIRRLKKGIIYRFFMKAVWKRVRELGNSERDEERKEATLFWRFWGCPADYV